MAAKFTRKEIAENKDTNKTIFIIENVVYDVTNFLDEHPGGHEVLVNVHKKDATEDFADIGHSVDAREMLKKWKIGDVADEDRIELKKKTYDWETAKNQDEGNFLSSWKFPLVLGIVMTVLYSYLFG